MLLAKIDYKIFVFRNSTNICKEVKLYEWLGLKSDWLKHLRL
jgi:hypothetical protein